MDSLHKIVGYGITKLDQQQKQLADPQSYHTLTYYQFHTLTHLYTTITPSSYTFLKPHPYITITSNAIRHTLNILIQTLQPKSQFHGLLSNVHSMFTNALNALNVPYNPLDQKSMYYQTQSWILIVVFVWKFVEGGYGVQARRAMRRFVGYLANPDLKVPVACLRWLQSNRQQIRYLSKVQQFIKLVPQTLSTLYNSRSNFLPPQSQQISPQLTLVPLNQQNKKRRKIVNIWISGFLSQDMDKKSHWSQLTQIMPDSQIYALQWKSDCITNLVMFIGKSCVQVVTAEKMGVQLKKKFVENPFVPAMEVAGVLGVYLAQVIIEMFGQQFVNLVGYSLGSQLIASCLQHLITRKHQHLLNNIYILGGVTDTIQLSTTIKKSNHPLSIYNCYTQNDLVLKHVLKICKPQTQPVGIFIVQEIKGHYIRNFQCSSLVSGHLSYMSNFQGIGRLLEMGNQ